MDYFEKILLGVAVLAVGIGVFVLIGSDADDGASRAANDRIDERALQNRPAGRGRVSVPRRKQAEESWPDLMELGVPDPVAEEESPGRRVMRPDDQRTPVQRRRRGDSVDRRPEAPNVSTGASSDRQADMNVQVHSYVGELIARSGPEAAEAGRQLMGSTNAILRFTGAAALSELNELDDGTLKRMANDEDPSVAVNLLGWLRDTGRKEQETELVRMIAERGLGAATMARLLDSGVLEAGGARVALDFMHVGLPSADAVDAYKDISDDAGIEYGIRMKALLLLRDKMAFEDYRDEVNRLAVEGGDDPVWREGIDRLARRLKGPTQFHKTAAITSDDIDVRLAREYPAMLEDLVLWLDYATARGDTYVSAGTSSCLDGYLAAYAERPWSDWQEVSLVRLKTIAARLAGIEKDERPVPANMPAPPPSI